MTLVLASSLSEQSSTSRIIFWNCADWTFCRMVMRSALSIGDCPKVFGPQERHTPANPVPGVAHPDLDQVVENGESCSPESDISSVTNWVR